ncbi:hypothetical protein [Pelagicoccus albus]|uniref:Secretin/TonB short N-terminal domain-containing protein n=1 Tax=Pelagicoccus albus TaxID=415222 RepID=A0A7X1E892_9BACT|nr:hypothetical protein [Pelagicoccus albus]MBC2606109.1 hypothetical protein [Pelagicoccus albus]
MLWHSQLRSVAITVIVTLCCVLAPRIQLANASEKQDWRLPSGDAIKTLRMLAAQGDAQIMYSDEAVQGTKTNAIEGRFTTLEALEAMLENTGLETIQTHRNRIFAIRAVNPDNSLGNGVATKPENSPNMNTQSPNKNKKSRMFVSIMMGILGVSQNAAAQTAPSTDEDQVFELSPFEVQASENDVGYHSENTLAGSRLNSKVSDLAASISIVGAQQLEDTASVDINDVFLYEANTEGTGNYTDYSLDKNGGVQDTAANSPQTANRVRGIGPAETARNYFPSISRIPFDAYNTATFEINRGPNSILFGLGNAAGIMNQSLAYANIGGNSNQAQIRVGNHGAIRASFNANRNLVDNKLAVFIAGVHDEKGFERKPSYDRTDRYYLNLSYRPLEKTNIKAFYERYENENRRPNNVTPRDLVTPWLEAGSPAWNPVERTVTVDGTTSGPYDTNEGLPSVLWDEYANGPIYLYNQGNLEAFTMRRLTTDPSRVDGGSTPYRTLVSGFDQEGPLWVAPGITDNSIYDWESINVISGNVGEDAADTYGIEFDQTILPNLYFNAGYYFEDFTSDNSKYISQQTGATIQVDPNTHRLDGSINPYFGRTFIEIREPDDMDQWETNENLRATLAYELDFTHRDDKLKWLGHHRLLGLASSRKVEDGYYRWRSMVTSDNEWVNDSNLSQGTGGAIYRRFYLSDSGSTIQYDPGVVRNGSLSYPLYRGVAASGATDESPYTDWTWSNEPVDTTRELHFVSSIGQREIDSEAIVMQNYLLEDKIITTLGWRKDTNRGRSTSGLSVDPATGRANPSDLGTSWGDWQEVSGNTSSVGIVAKPLDWMFLHYNKSDNFQPAGVAYDINDGSFLPLPTGEGKDYGVSFESPDGKLYARLNWFETTQRDSRAGPTGTFIWRMGYYDNDAFYDWAVLAARYEGLTGAAADARVKEITQLPDNFNDYRSNVVGTSDVKAKGMELNLAYNPRNNWNIKFNVAQQETVYDNIAEQYDRWKAVRLPIWMAAHSDAMPEGYQDFWTYDNLTAPDQIRRIAGIGGASTRTPELWFNINVDANMALQKKLEGKVSPSQREWRWNVITNYAFEDGPLKNFGIGGSLRWEDEAAIGYLGGEPDSDGIVRQLDADSPVYDDSQYHVDFWASYRMKAFSDKVDVKFQFNVRDLFEDGGLQAVGVNPDGSASAYRIVDSREFFFTTTFEF